MKWSQHENVITALKLDWIFRCRDLLLQKVEKKYLTTQHVRWSRSIPWCTLGRVIFWERVVKFSSPSYLLLLRKMNYLKSLYSILGHFSMKLIIVISRFLLRHSDVEWFSPCFVFLIVFFSPTKHGSQRLSYWFFLLYSR